MGDLSAHFSSGEFIDRRTGERRDPPEELLRLLERIRALRPGPLVIVSGYRSPSTNALVGGAPRSRHLQGDAADIPAGRATAAEALRCGAVGIGVSDGWVTHVDVRPGWPVQWRY